MTGVGCEEDCRYKCMWLTVEEMEVRAVNITSVHVMKMIDILIQVRHGFATGIPQFHGKWPFIRILGMTEPASVLFSVLNLATNLWMLMWFRSRVPASAPMASMWTFYSLTAINAWICSTIFHTRYLKRSGIKNKLKDILIQRHGHHRDHGLRLRLPDSPDLALGLRPPDNWANRQQGRSRHSNVCRFLLPSCVHPGFCQV